MLFQWMVKWRILHCVSACVCVRANGVIQNNLSLHCDTFYSQIVLQRQKSWVFIIIIIVRKWVSYMSLLQLIWIFHHGINNSIKWFTVLHVAYQQVRCKLAFNICLKQALALYPRHIFCIMVAFLWRCLKKRSIGHIILLRTPYLGMQKMKTLKAVWDIIVSHVNALLLLALGYVQIACRVFCLKLLQWLGLCLYTAHQCASK